MIDCRIPALLGLFLPFLTSPEGLAAPCGEPGGHALGIAAIDERLEIRLDDGRRLRLAGIEPPRATEHAPDWPGHVRAALADWLLPERGTIDIELLSAVPDRWNRLPARVFAPAGGSLLSVAEALVDAGLARVDPDPIARPCLSPLFALEARARIAGLGLWNDPALTILPAGDHAALAAASGAVALVEGRVTGVGTTPARTYLNFGPVRTVDFAVTIARQNLRNFEKSGMFPQALSGKVLRVRGLVETQAGPQIEISSPDAVEIITADGAGLPYSGPMTRQ